MNRQDSLGLSGLLTATIEVPPEQIDLAVVEGMDILEWDRERGRIVGERENAFVNLGLQITLDRLFALNGPPAAISNIGLSSDNTAVTATTTTVGGTVAIKAFSPAASRAAQVVTAGATFTQADVSFSIRKVFLLNTGTDAGTGTLDIIGGSGASPYNQPFTIDLTGVTTFSLLTQIQITASAT